MSDAEQTAYQEKMEAKLTKLDAELRRLEGELKEQKADARKGMEEQLQQLRDRSASVQSGLHRLRSSSGAAWNQAKDGVAAAWHDLESSLEAARKQFQEQRE